MMLVITLQALMKLTITQSIDLSQEWADFETQCIVYDISPQLLGLPSERNI
jgi:hypothetical protein